MRSRKGKVTPASRPADANIAATRGRQIPAGKTHDAARGAPAQRASGVAAETAALHLLPYQRRWVADNSPLKIVVKARQIGYSFAATLRAVLECLKRKTTWIFLSKGERQSRLLMEKVQEHIHSCGIIAQACESTFFEGTLIKQLETRFPNGSVIYGLPANPDTARGYSGHVTLDEFAFHADADKIYSALFPTVTRGYSLEVISTPNGQQGKFYELAKAAGLTEADLKFEISNSARPGGRTWSAHACDIYAAERQGLKIDLQLLRAGCDDESSWQQEYCCQFVSTAENFIPPDLLTPALSAEASMDTPLPMLASAPRPPSPPAPLPLGEGVPQGRVRGEAAASEFYLGIDIGRHHDRTVFWLDEVAPPPAAAEFRTQNSELSISVTRLVRTLEKTPFAEQLAMARELLSLAGPDGGALIRRACIDATGMGAPLAESLAREFGPRVEPVTFSAAVKEDLAYRTKRRLESRLSLLPDTREIRRAFSAVKRMVTVTGSLRFDAERTEAGHADEFWAKALADLAADYRPVARLADGFLVEGTPIIAPAAFVEVDTAWAALGSL